MTYHFLAGRNQVVFVVLLVFAGGLVWPAQVSAQLRDDRARQEAARLRQQDAALRSSIQGQRIDRQVEIGRLEGRIDKLEKLVRGLPQQLDHAGFIALLVTLDEERELVSSLPNTADDVPQPLPEKERRQQRQQVLQLIAQDYMAALKVAMLEAQVVLLEHSLQVTSLERLAIKGLATRPQLELQQLKQQNAEARFARLEQQQAGLTRLFPTLFAGDQPPPAEEQQGPEQP